MQTKSVTASRKIDGEEYSVSANLEVPETLDEAKDLWGEEITLSNAESNVVISFQGLQRRRLEKMVKEAKEKGEEPDLQAINQQVATDLAGYKPGKAAPKTDPIESMLSKFQSLPEDKQAELIEQLKAKAGA